MIEYKTLKIQGTVLEEYQLKNYMEKIASDHILKNKSNKNTYPIPSVKENFAYITDTYNLLNEHIKIGIPIHPAGEWILDNYYLIEKTAKTITKDLTLKKYTNFLGIASGNYQGFARVYVLAAEIVAYTDGKITEEVLNRLLKSYQNKKTLSMDEIWNIGIFLQIALIEKIKEVCEKIYASQVQKYKVENIIERLVENKENLKFKTIQFSNRRFIEYSDMKYPFIEYMSYRLRSYGKKAYSYLNVLEEAVNKMGMDISEAIRKEHFDIAVRKVSIGNSIASINKLSRINFLEIFEKINGVEEILKEDPASVYDKMDFKTKSYYRNQIEKISKKTKISEMYIAKKCLELALKAKEDKQNLKLTHIGYYLISYGRKKLYEELLNKPIEQIDNNQKADFYIVGNVTITVLIDLFFMLYTFSYLTNVAISVLIGVLLYFPIQSIVTQIINYVLSKIIQPKLIPKLDYQNGIPEDNATMVIIPTILKNKEKVRELIEKLEVYYISNKSENLYFTLLGDCTSSNTKVEKFDDEIIDEGLKQIYDLNKKYIDDIFPKFNFVYRERTWNTSEECYLGWERKRGLINQFNEYILGNIPNIFRANTIEKYKQDSKKMPKIKYIITLDSDTELVLNTGLELVGAMSHILNKPVLNDNKDLVIDGYGIMQPRIGVGLLETKKSIFTKIFAGLGGIDSYTNAISDVYQDNFGEGIFTGKGIYDLEIFSKVLKKEIPENTVLSHDLLEGCYLRCGLVSDIMLMDGYPTSYNAYKSRLHRWIRGDYQILKWLKGTISNKTRKTNPLNALSKYKIIDNIFRSLTEFSTIVILSIMLVLYMNYNIKIWPIISSITISILISPLLELINLIVSKKDGQKNQKTFVKSIGNFSGSLLRGLIALAVWPDKAYFSINAAIKTIYRMVKSKKHLLEWTTAEEAEKNVKRDLKSYYMNMPANALFGTLGIFFLILNQLNLFSILIFLISILWIIAPAIMWYISMPIKCKSKLKEVSIDDQNYLMEIGKKTWHFFKDNLNEKSNFLPPDNYQHDRKPRVICRTSPTNIGLALLAVISSYDLKYENVNNTINLLEKMIDSIVKLPKWNGHLYNWYNLENLQPVRPMYVSSVDSGNFVGYLYVVKQFLNSIYIDEYQEIDKVNYLENQINVLIENTDFTKLYDEKTRLFSIGYNCEENKLTDSYYDLLASEARQTSLVAIAKKDIFVKHWYNLSRTLTVLNNYKGLISWSGTAFEYLMPNINIPKYSGSLLDESCKFMIMSQKEYAKKLGIPWGISEAAFNLKDLNNNYQYKAFGIPWLGLKRGLADEMVVSSYGTILALSELPNDVIINLKRLEKLDMYNKYGFYESIDFTPNRVPKGKNSAPVKTYMAHHQGLILASLNNFFNDNIFQKRFMSNPEIQAINILLQERMPENVVITKEKKEKAEKIKYKDYENYTQRLFNKVNEKMDILNAISNKNYTVIINQKGEGYSKYKDILINRFKSTSDDMQGIFFYIKNIKSNKIWTNGQAKFIKSSEKYNIKFAPDKNEFSRVDGNIETKTSITVDSNEPVELRKIELKNIGNEIEQIELTSYLEPVLSTKEQDYAHMAFNKLFLKYEYISEKNIMIVKRKKRNVNETDLYLGLSLYSNNFTLGDIEYEISKEKFWGRGNYGVPELIKNSKPLGNKNDLTIDSIVAFKEAVEIKPDDTAIFNLIIGVSKDKKSLIDMIENFSNSEKINRTFELSRARVEAETRYLGLTGKNIELYQRLLSYLLINNQIVKKRITNDFKCNVMQLWKYGISGDLPILTVKIKNINEIKVVEEAINAYEFFKLKNIDIDLVIINEEKESYESYIKEGIQDIIWNKNIEYMQNIKAGIFVLNNISNEEKKLIEIRSNFVLDCHFGNIENQLDDMEEI